MTHSVLEASLGFKRQKGCPLSVTSSPLFEKDFCFQSHISFRTTFYSERAVSVLYQQLMARDSQMIHPLPEQDQVVV